MFLKESACAYLMLPKFSQKISEQIKTKLTSSKNTFDITVDLLDEIHDAFRMYSSFFWDSHPLCRHSLEDTHPLITTKPETIQTEERKKWHERIRLEILDEQMLDHNQQPVARKAEKEPWLVLLGGGGASGKSFVLQFLRTNNIEKEILSAATESSLRDIRSHLQKRSKWIHLLEEGLRRKSGKQKEPKSFIVINADSIKLVDPIYRKISDYGDCRAASIVHNDSNKLALSILEESIDKKYNVIYDGTFSDIERSMPILKAATAKKYKILIVGVTVDTETAIRRSLERGWRTKRMVPIQNLIKAHKQFSTNFERYLPYTDAAILFDNTDRGDEVNWVRGWIQKEMAEQVPEAYPRVIAFKSPEKKCVASGMVSDCLAITDQEAYDQFLLKSQLNDKAVSLSEMGGDLGMRLGGVEG
eukprot:TRINITY_DN4163_c0_g1_i1.p1 TRINITY_DN4163_c0_g1~~TRINITY_DN4163_c0_g1_i1.p1  ORF type:complete len:416 (+),score=123.21 TRINITY_DN4163_c0_g1_i1:94-1341(+)